MDGLSLAVLISQSFAGGEATSALPDAPVVDDGYREHRPRAARSRTALARGLQWAAAAIAPAGYAPRPAAPNC